MNAISTDIDNITVSSAFTCSTLDCCKLKPSSGRNLSCLTQNIRSIGRNFPGLLVLLQQIGFELDILVLTECWLSCCPNIPSLDNYDYYKTSNNANQNEGVVVYIKNNIKVIVEEPQFDEGNCIVLKIDNIAVVCIYRSPSYKNLDIFLKSLDKVLSSISSANEIIMLGDINIDIHTCSSSANSGSNSYLNLMASHGLLPTHTYVTRDESGSCLDHTFLKSKSSAVTLVPQTTLTDHKAVLIFLPDAKSKREQPISHKTIINYCGITSDLEQVSLEPLYDSTDPNICISFLTQAVQTIIQNNTKTIKVPCRKRVIKPWITPGILKCIRNRDKLHLNTKKPNNEIALITYRRYRNYCNKLIKNIKIQYEKSLLEKAGNNNKKIWDTIKSITSTSKQKNCNQDLLTNSSSAEHTLNNINDYYCKVGKTLAEKIRNKKITSNSPSTSKITNANSFGLIMVDVKELDATIMSLKSICSVGVDEISNKILKQNKHFFIPPLTYIFNLCIDKGIFPSLLKKSVVIPIHKNGDKTCVENYRPISILPAISKLLEKILNWRLVNYLEKNSILSPNQFAFRSGRSTDDAVQDLTNFVSNSLDEGSKCLSIFLDLAKAFDTISVPLLVKKLDNIGIRGTPLKLFQNYLSGRTQLVKIGSQTSSEIPSGEYYGVPQGSILGPTLFLVYINDLCSLKPSHGEIICYADDTALMFKSKSWEDTFAAAQTGLDTVTKWLQDNYLTLNTTKTKYMTFSIRNNTQPRDELELFAHDCDSITRPTFCHCVPLQKVASIRYLGIIIDENLSFKPHISLLTSRVRKLIYIFKNLRQVAEPHILKRVYFSLCQSLLRYCISSWGGAPKTILLPLEIAQRAVLKVCTFRNFLYPTHLLYAHCEVLTVRQLFLLSIIIKQHSLTPFVTQNPPKRRAYRVCEPNKVYKTAFAQKFFPFLGPYIYNKINKILNIHNKIKSSSKIITYNYLQKLTYTETECVLEIEH